MHSALIPAPFRGVALAAKPSYAERTSISVPATSELRGFGRVASQTAMVRDAGGNVAVTIFRCQDADLDLSLGTIAATVVVAGPQLAYRTLAGGIATMSSCAGAEVRVVTAACAAELVSRLGERLELARGAVGSTTNPAWLDRYGLGGYALSRECSGYAKQKRSELSKNDASLDDLAFCTVGGWRFEQRLDPAGFNDSDGGSSATEGSVTDPQTSGHRHGQWRRLRHLERPRIEGRYRICRGQIPMTRTMSASPGTMP